MNRQGLLSRPCARMETGVEFLLGVILTLFTLAILAMLLFGPQIMEWVEDC